MKTLPIFEKKNEIIKSVIDNDITIISAETGSGKSTQVPQYLYREGFEVIVTEPRRIAAVSLAERVKKEIMERMGDIYYNTVAYKTAFESNVTGETEILFCTDGLQMAKGIDSKKLKNTVLILDEVHEWNLNIETLIAWIKNEKKNGSDLKVVLMSATIDYEALALYYSDVAKVNTITVPNSNYDVEMHHNLHKFDISRITVNSILSGKNVLIFQPGKPEIAECINDIKNEITDRELALGLHIDAQILPMHGELQIDEQNKCFEHYEIPKVIVATNIAQTSITIDDIDVVVDSGEEKVIEVIDGIEGLYSRPISKADCDQRAGRAGRTHSGEYYLCSNCNYENRDEFSTPEIQRLLLDKVVLKLASIGLDAENLDFYHQPALENIKEAKRILKSLGAFNKDSEITEIGKKMILMPVSSKSARMLIEADALGCLNEMITIVSIMENGSLINFKAEVERTSTYMGNYKLKACYGLFTEENDSDLIAEMNIYHQILDKKFKNLKNAGINAKNFFKIKAFCEKLHSCIIPRLFTNSSNNDKNTLIKCMLSGMGDNIFVSGWDDKYSNGVITANLNNNSCVYYSKFVIATPLNIQYVNRWGIKDSMTILTNVTRLNSDIILEVFADAIDDNLDLNFCKYDPIKCEFMVSVNKKLNGILIDSEMISVTKNDDIYEYLMNEYSDEVAKENDRIVKINGKIYCLEKHYDGTYHISLNRDEVLNLNTDFILTDSGKRVKIYCEWYSSFSVNELKNRIKMEMEENEKNIFLSSLPKKTGKIEDVIHDMFPFVGDKVIGNSILYMGLKKDKGSVMIVNFNNNETRDESTKEALEFLVMKKVNESYNDKNFRRVETLTGKKIETKSTIKAKDDFHAIVSMVVDEINVNNFEENLKFIDESFNELVSNF